MPEPSSEEWYEDYKTEFEYDQDGNTIFIIFSEWDWAIDDWLPDTRHEQIYDGEGNIIEGYISEWDEDLNIWEVYLKMEYTLIINITGNGTVEINGTIYTDAIDIAKGSDVVIKAIADEGWEFNGWTGDLDSDNATETITMNSNISITANFSIVSTVATIDPPGLAVFPNPFRDHITINITRNIKSVTITNLAGQITWKLIKN